MTDVTLDIDVCPECRQQLHPEGDEYSVECYDHGRLVRGVQIKVTVDSSEIDRQLVLEAR